jgi:hypothetical protein
MILLINFMSPSEQHAGRDRAMRPLRQQAKQWFGPPAAKLPKRVAKVNNLYRKIADSSS